jgi:EmrB/QacA subfamily drug resistance transporter
METAGAPGAPPPATAVAGLSRREWSIVALLLLGTFMAVLDGFIVNVAIPSIRVGLGTNTAEAELVVAGYFLTYGSLLITGGRLGDILDRKRVFLWGMALFTVASAFCGLAPNAAGLIISRAVQGVGAALMYPQVFSIIQVRFTGARRLTALSAYGAVVGLAAVAGQLLGGALIQANLAGLGWRTVFLVNVPVGIVSVVLGARVLEPSRASPSPKLDLGGVVLIGATLAILILSLTEGSGAGWPTWSLVSLGSLPFLFAAFVLYERWIARRTGFPLVDPSLFRQRGFSIGIPVALLFFCFLGGFFFTLTLFLQDGLHLTPVQAGLTFAPMGLAFLGASLLTPRLTWRLGKYLLTLGYGSGFLGVLFLALLLFRAPSNLSAYTVLPALVVIGLGWGFGLSPLVGTVLARVSPNDVGSASGTMSTGLQIGIGLGVATAGPVFFEGLSMAGTGSALSLAAYTHAFVLALVLLGTFLLTCAILVLFLPRSQTTVSDVLLGSRPHHPSRLAYSFYHFTGGRLPTATLDQIVEEAAPRRLARMAVAPDNFADFLVYHYKGSAADLELLRVITLEALEYHGGRVAGQEARDQVIRRSVEEIRDRQAKGTVRADLDPECLRLMAFALVTYPRMYGNITMGLLGLAPNDPRFEERWARFLSELGKALSGPSPGPPRKG